MQKIEAGAPESQSADLVAENIALLRSLFPELVTESADGMAVNVDVLKQLVGDQTVTDAEEKYGLNWHGKRRARQLALTPSTGTLRPCPEESVDWDTTQNLMIEGDNLEVLKLLQKSYSGRVKLIYIDPPYNTGKDFVYPDNFKDNIRNYLEITGQVEGDRKITSNAETSGRFHTDWLAMMYPRLKLARNLLSKDGVLFISIDDSEVANLREICDEILGEENFLACFIWKSRQNKDNRTLTGASIDHEYMLCYGQGVRGDARKIDQYSNPDNDPRGDWTSANMVGIATADRRPNLHYDLIDPETQTNYGCPKLGWRFEPKTMERLIAEDRILWPKDSGGRPRRKAFLSELTSEFTGFSTIIGSEIFTRDGTRDIDDLFGLRVFDFPKPVELLQSLVEQATSHGDIVLDFFAGSGSSAQAVLTQNNADGGTRRYILIQLPEQLDPNNPDQRTGAEFCRKHKLPLHISEITKERLRRVSKKLRKESSLTTLDLGFRVFKLDSTNIREWSTAPKDLAAELELHTEHVKEDRSESDILYELLLKLGLDLCIPMEVRTVPSGKRKHHVTSIGGGVLMACLSESITRDDVETLGLAIVQWHQELAPAGDTTCVFRDSAFEDDVAKTNMAAILTQHGFTRVRSL